MIGTIVESRPAQYFRQLPLSARVLIITTLALAILAGVYFARSQMGTAAALLSSSGLATFAELLRRLMSEKPKTAPDEVTYSIHTYAPDKLKKQTEEAISQEDVFCTRTTPLTPLDLTRKVTVVNGITDGNQDANLSGTFDLKYNTEIKKVPIIGIFDGELDNGEASSYMASNFVPLFQKAVGETGWGLSDRIIANALTETFVTLGKTYEGEGYSDATVAITIDNKTYVPSIGPSKAVVITETSASFLTHDLGERHLGPDEKARPKIACIEKKAGDILLLASSPFWKYLSLNEIKEAVLQMKELSDEDKANRLIDLAQLNGCKESLTVIIRTE